MSNAGKAGVPVSREGRTGSNGARRRWRLGRYGAQALLVAAVVAGGWPGTSQASTLGTPPRDRLLATADLPAGWSATPPTAVVSLKKVHTTSQSCLVAVEGWAYGAARKASFVEGTVVPKVTEVLGRGEQAQESWARFGRTLAGCRAATFVDGKTTVVASVHPLALAGLGAGSSAYAVKLAVSYKSTSSSPPVATGENGDDMVLFRAGPYYGYLSFDDVVPPQVSTVEAFARAAVAKASGGSTEPVPDATSITSVPVQTVHTFLGRVGYREMGTGAPLVMVNGWSGTMETWDRLFVDDLAAHYRVIIFDNAGIGRTQHLPAPLTIDAMADQTAAFIDALHLRRPDVLGWSMGTTIVEALDVLHPSDVGRMVLCAPYPGNGHAVLAAHSVLDGSPDPTGLFPANQVAADYTYEVALTSWPKSAAASQAIDNAQLKALYQWWAGGDPAGHLVAKTTAPTLLADGADDRLDPIANIHLLARLIPGAKMKVYPDAGHGFLFQDATAFTGLVESFLGQAR